MRSPLGGAIHQREGEREIQFTEKEKYGLQTLRNTDYKSWYTKGVRCGDQCEE